MLILACPCPVWRAGSGVAERNGSGPAAGSAPAMTSGNENDAPTVAGSAPQNGESRPPQAIVKPQVLTHVIEGFVIQEGAEPFPVSPPHLTLSTQTYMHAQAQTHTCTHTQTHPTQRSRDPTGRK